MDIYAIISGFGIFLIFYYAQGIMNKKGQEYDIYSYGVVATCIVVYVHHIQVAIHVRNWTKWLFMWLCISLAFLPITCFLSQMGKTNEMKKAIYGQLLTSLPLNAIILCISGVCIVPLIFYKFVHEIFFWPKFYMND